MKSSFNLRKKKTNPLTSLEKKMPQIKRNVILGPGGERWVYDVYDSYQNRIYTTSDKHKADEVFKRLEREHQERQAQIKAATK